MNKEHLQKYAELIVKSGINIKKDQVLVIRSPLDCAEFTRIIAREAYKAGAYDVEILWSDQESTKIRYMLGTDELFDEVPTWQKEFFLTNVKRDAAFLSIAASDPSMMKDVDVKRLQQYTKTFNRELGEYRDRLMNNDNAWCVVAAPIPAWAIKVFPDLSEVDAMDRLWDMIFKAVRADQEDPVKAWEDHKENLSKNIKTLNELNLKELHFKNSKGTDFTLELPVGHIWVGGSEHTTSNHEFIANIPTEEIFTTPHKTGINGKIVSSMPLNFNGSLIDDFEFTVENGRIVDFSAKEGYEQLKSLVETDEGSHYFGEIALVAYDSPISNMNTLFYNTLFDENASCHLAIGKAYPMTIDGGDKMTKEELIEHGVNDSIMHEDFMIGTADLSIVGTATSGEKVQIFKNGNFVI
jgi:aminopeptidase